MQLANINKRINQNKNILKITNALKVMSITRIKSLKIKEGLVSLALKKIEEIKDISIKEVLNMEVVDLESSLERKIELNILFFTDMSFCGNINKRNQGLNWKNLENIILVGAKGKKIKGNFLGKLYEKDLLKKLMSILKKTIEGEGVSQIVVNLWASNKKKIFLYKKQEEKIKEEYFNCYFYFKVQEFILGFQKEESMSRLMKVTSAISNSEELNESLKSLYNSTRQKTITSQLIELLASGEEN